MANAISKMFGSVRKAFLGKPFSAAWTPSWHASAGRNPWALVGTAQPEALTAVHSATRLLTGGLMGATISLTRARPDGGSEKITGTNLALMLSSMTSELEPVIYDYLNHGNGFARVIRSVAGEPDGLEWISAKRCSLARNLGTTEHWLRVSPQFSDVQQVEHIKPGDFLHLKFLPSDDELMGQSPLERLAPGMTMAAQIVQTANAIVKNAAQPGGIMTVAGNLKPDAIERLRREFQQKFTGENAGKFAILDFETKLDRMPSAESMISDAYVQLARFGIAEVARAYNVPLSLLAEPGSVNRATASEESRNFVTFSVMPLARQIADAMSKLLVARGQLAQGVRITFDLSGALMGQGVERAEYASKLVNAGLASVNEARNLILGLPDVQGGEEIARPVNTLPQSAWLESGQPAPAAAPAPAPVQMMFDANGIKSTAPANANAANTTARQMARFQVAMKGGQMERDFAERLRSDRTIQKLFNFQTKAA